MSPEQPDTVRERPGGRSARVREEVLACARRAIAEGGYDALTHSQVAAAAGVDRSTVYRRWPSRAALAADALLSTTRAPSIPDAGSLAADLLALAEQLADRLRRPEVRRAMLTFSLAVHSDAELSGAGQRFWTETLQEAAVIVRRAAERGESAPDAQGERVIEALVAPIIFRSLISGSPAEPDLIADCVDDALRCSGSSAASGRPGRRSA